MMHSNLILYYTPKYYIELIYTLVFNYIILRSLVLYRIIFHSLVLLMTEGRIFKNPWWPPLFQNSVKTIHYIVFHSITEYFVLPFWLNELSWGTQEGISTVTVMMYYVLCPNRYIALDNQVMVGIIEVFGIGFRSWTL